MLHGEALGLLLGAVALGAVHGMEPGHGWPVAATYALDQRNKWLSGFAASFILGVGHLISSIAMVGVFFYAKSYFSLTQVNEPLTVFGLTIGGPVSIVAGVLLVLLGLREYYGGHSHGHGGDDGHGHSHQVDGGHAHGHDEDSHTHPNDGDSHTHGHDEDGHTHPHDEDSHTHPHDGDGHTHPHDEDGHTHDGHSHDHAHEEGGNSHDAGHSHAGHSHSDQSHAGHSHEHDDHHDHADSDPTFWGRVRGFVPFAGGHSHDHGDLDEAAERGLFGIAWFAFLLGFAHEEEFEIIALCAGSTHCLELMSAYALTVIVGIVGLTMLLVAGYEHYEERVERYTPYLPAFSAAVLILMGLGFVTGLF